MKKTAKSEATEAVLSPAKEEGGVIVPNSEVLIPDDVLPKVGRPFKIQTVEEFEERAAEYFEGTVEERWTITGLALALDTSRETLCNYEARDEFFDAIKKAKTMVENAYELSLRKRGNAGDIFGLKNFGWKDDRSLNVKGEIEDNRPLKDKSEAELLKLAASESKQAE